MRDTTHRLLVHWLMFWQLQFDNSKHSQNAPSFPSIHQRKQFDHARASCLIYLLCYRFEGGGSKPLGYAWCAWHCFVHIPCLLDTKIPMFITAGLKIVNMRKLIALSHVHHCLCPLSSTLHHNNTATSKFCCCHTIYSKRLCSLHKIERHFQN